MIKIITTDGATAEFEGYEGLSVAQLKEWIGCEHIEVVGVLYEGKREQLIIDDIGRQRRKPINHKATTLYLENAKIYSPLRYAAALMDSDENIIGTAVLLTEKDKLA